MFGRPAEDVNHNGAPTPKLLRSNYLLKKVRPISYSLLEISENNLLCSYLPMLVGFANSHGMASLS